MELPSLNTKIRQVFDSFIAIGTYSFIEMGEQLQHSCGIKISRKQEVTLWDECSHTSCESYCFFSKEKGSVNQVRLKREEIQTAYEQINEKGSGIRSSDNTPKICASQIRQNVGGNL